MDIKRIWRRAFVFCLTLNSWWQAAPARAATDPAQPAATEAFGRFPIDHEVSIKFDVDEDYLLGLSPRESEDQLRDWIFYAVIGDSGLSAEQLSRCLFDLPPLRQGYLRAVANFAFDETRSRSIEGGRVVALIPSGGSGVERRDRLVRIADASRKDTGEPPHVLLVFEYSIDPGSKAAKVVRRPDISGQQIQSKEYGYVEANIRSAGDLERFLEQAADVTYAELKDNGLIVGGRRIEGTAFRPMRLEDVAALWQAQERVGRTFTAFLTRWKEKEDGLKTRLRARILAAKSEEERAKVVREALEERDQLLRDIIKDRSKQKVVEGLGFSLDPTYDYASLSALVKELAGAVKRVRDGELVSADRMSQVAAALEKHDLEPLRKLLHSLKGQEDLVTGLLHRILAEAERAFHNSGPPNEEKIAAFVVSAGEEVRELAGGEGSELGPARLKEVAAALARQDETPLAELIGRLARREGFASRLFCDVLKRARVRSHERGPLDRERLSAFLAELGRELTALTAPGGAVAPEAVEAARAAAARRDPAPFRALIVALAQGTGPVAKALHGQLASAGDSLLGGDEDDLDELARFLQEFAANLTFLGGGETPILTVHEIDDVRRALAQKDEATFTAWIDRLENSKNPLVGAVGDAIQDAVTTYRGCDFPGLSSYFASFARAVPGLIAEGGPFSAKVTERIRQATQDHEKDAYHEWLGSARKLGEPLGFPVFAALVSRESSFSTPDDKGLADVVRKLADGLMEFSSDSDHLPGISKLGEIAGDAERGDPLPFLKVVDAMERSDNVFLKVLGQSLDERGNQSKYQAARYDGDLQGTEVAMDLFYTDLLAKLWALDYRGSAPEREVREFRPLTEVRVAPIYRERDQELPDTRLWFGPQEQGYQLGPDKNILWLARNVTRIYAAGSNPLRPGKEENPSASSEAFLGWWNDHYEDVARTEPEYQRLNAIMKWSMVIAWLDERKELTRFRFLGPVPVDRSRWFPDWAKSRPELTFREWDRIGFQPRGAHGTTTESMPLLYSREFLSFDSVSQLAGGVSLPNTRAVVQHPVLSPKVAESARRAFIDPESVVQSNGLVFKTPKGTSYTFDVRERNRASVTIQPESGAALRNRTTELLSDSVGSDIVRDGEVVRASVKVGGHDVAGLEIRPTGSGNAFTVGLRRRVLAESQDMARRVSTSSDTFAAISGTSEVETVVKQGDEGGLFVKFRDSDRWVRITGAGDPDGATLRVADTSLGAMGLNVAVLDAGGPKITLEEGELIRIPPQAAAGHGFAVEVNARGPPKARDFDVDGLKGLIDPATGAIYFRGDDLPEAVRDDPSAWRDLNKKINHEQLAREAATPGDQPIHLSALPHNQARDAADALRGVTGDLAAKNFVQARHHLEDVQGALRDTPEYRICETLTKLARERMSAAQIRDSLIGIERSGPRQTADFIREVNNRLSQSQLLPKDRVALRNAASLADWSDQMENGTLPRRRLVGFIDGLGWFRKATVLDGSIQGELITEGTPVEPDAEVYIQDGFGINNLDLNLPVEGIIAQVIESKVGDVRRLVQEDIAHFKPDRIYEPISPRTPGDFNDGNDGVNGGHNGSPSLNPRERSYHRVGSYRSTYGPPQRGQYTAWPGCDNDDDDAREPGPLRRTRTNDPCNKSVYYITARKRDER